MHAFAAHAISAVTLTLLAACANLPTGPSVAVIPGAGKTNEQFDSENDECRRYAENQTRAATNRANGMSVEITADEAPQANGHVVGESAIGYGADKTQRVYDLSYTQCMFRKGNTIPLIR